MTAAANATEHHLDALMVSSLPVSVTPSAHSYSPSGIRSSGITSFSQSPEVIADRPRGASKSQHSAPHTVVAGLVAGHAAEIVDEHAIEASLGGLVLAAQHRGRVQGRHGTRGPAA